MYRKRTKTSQENTGNSKKRRLKYDIYDSRFHKSYNNIKTGGYDDYSIVMDGGANTTSNVSTSVVTENKNKDIFKEKDNAITTFVAKWFKNLDENNNNKLDIINLSINFVDSIGENVEKYDTLLLELFKKFAKPGAGITNISNNLSFEKNYIETIIEQINTEDKNTIAVFEYDLFLYNLDSILSNYKQDNKKFSSFFTQFKTHIENAQNLFKVNSIIENVNDKDNSITKNSKKMKMYIPKLLKSVYTNNTSISVGGAKQTSEPYAISKLKTLENSNKTQTDNKDKKIRTKFTDNDLWNTVLNDGVKHYGFEGETPKNLMNSDFTLSNNKDTIERYFKKCNDLQQLYINKHIELFDIFKKMNDYISVNDKLNNIIKKLVDPNYVNMKGKDGKLKLPNKLLENIEGNFLEKQTMVQQIVESVGGSKTNQNIDGGGNTSTEAKPYVVYNVVDYEFLQLIKEIQLSNETSIKNILGIKNNDNTKLDTLIEEYQKNINQSNKKDINKLQNPKWQSFNITNTNNLYFNNSNILGETSSDPETIQKVIYKCYDLQILYLVKHIEVIEMFKLVYYYYDMMIKKIGILFFILSLYHKSDIDFTDVVIQLPLDKLKNVSKMLEKQTSLQQPLSGGADTKEEIIEIINTLKKEIEEYNKQENSKYENKKIDYKTKVLEKIKPLLDSNDPPPLKLFNHLLTYFKAFSDYIDGNKDNIKKYDYIDKLLIKLLKTILPDIARTKNEGEYNKEEAKQIFNVVKNIYFDIIEQEINIQRKQDNVKKERSSYGVVKIGQFSKMDYDISQTIAKNFEKIFEYRIKDEIDYSKDSYKNYTQQYKTLDTLTELLVNARTLLKEPKKKEEAKEVIRKIEESMEKLFNSVEGDVNNEEETLVGGAHSKLNYISDAINANKQFGEGDIPNIDTNETNDPQHIRTSLFEQYRLNFLELLKNVYFPKDNKVDLKTMDIDTEIGLLGDVLQRVRYKAQEDISNNNKSNVIYIKQSAFKVLKTQKEGLETKKSGEAERLRKEEEAERRAQEEAERQKAVAAKTAENAETKTKERQSILDKIKYMIALYETKQEDEKINSDLEAYTIQLLGINTAINGLILLTAENWWKDRKSENQITTPEDTNIYNTHYSQLLSILQGSALIYVNLKPKQGGAKQEMFDVDYPKKTIDLKDLCKDKNINKNSKFGFDVDNPHGPYELVFPEEINKNEKIYQTLFVKSTDKEKKVKFIVEKTDTELQKQELMTSIENGKSVVLFGFGFSGSGKTYTLIEGKADGSDTSILYQFIENNKEKIDSIEFLEIYPDPDKPTFFVGNNKEKELSDIINPEDKNNEIKEDKKYDTISKEEITTIEKRIAEIEKHRREQLRILPTPNNPNSSRSFLQITIKMAKGGQLVIFDMPGTESTVRIKEMMLGKESYVDNTTLKGCNDFKDPNTEKCFKFNEAAKDYFLNIKNKIKKQEPKTTNTFDITLCKILHKLLTYKSHPTNPGGGCSISNLFEGFDETIKDYHIKNNNIYQLVTIKYSKQNDNSYTISSVQAIQNNDNTKIIMNVLFKYFILNIFKFWHLGIELPLEKEKRSECDKYIAKIGFELACFFNKKAYSTYDDYFKQTILDEIVFLKDEDYKKIYDQFLKVILIPENFSKNNSDISLSADISNEEQKIKMMKIFGFKVDKDTEIKFTLTSEVFIQTLENIQKINPNFLDTEKTHTKSIFIKYILFILSYIKQKSETLKTKVFDEIGTEKVEGKNYEQFTSVTLEELTELYNQYNSSIQQEPQNKYEDLTKQIREIKIDVSLLKKKQNPLNTTNSIYQRVNSKYGKLNLNSDKKSTQPISLLEKAQSVQTYLNTQLYEITKYKINYISAKAIYDIENMRLRASVYFIYKYIKFIVNQGSGIMTTLEHLKFFFLSRAGKIVKYNEGVENSKVFTIENGKDIFNKPVTYTNKEGEIEEKINIGQMKKYGLISILQSLAGDETDLEKISKNKLKDNKLKDTMIPNLLTPKQSVAQPAEQTQNTTKSKFIMLAHINPFPNTDENEEKQKKCKSASDTLAYIDSISANNLDIISVGANSGGSYRKKKYYKDINSSLLPTLKQHRIKRFTTLKKLNKNKKNLFTSKTKKLL